MSHSHKDAVGGHVIHGFLGAEEKRFTKRFNRREARREQVAITRDALFEAEIEFEDWWYEDSFYDEDYYSSAEYDNWLRYKNDGDSLGYWEERIERQNEIWGYDDYYDYDYDWLPDSYHTQYMSRA